LNRGGDPLDDGIERVEDPGLPYSQVVHAGDPGRDAELQSAKEPGGDTQVKDTRRKTDAKGGEPLQKTAAATWFGEGRAGGGP